jgi:uncharacterized protein YjbI with pentapeptide repeats
MRVIKPQHLSLVTRCFEHQRRFFLSVGVLALQDFGGRLVSEVSAVKFLAEELGADGLPDAGMPKPRSEFLVRGYAFSPAGQTRSKCKVRVRFGVIEKTLQIFGNRFWPPGMGDPSTAEPFERMPITWENAFGGPGFAHNPVGKGFAPVETKNGPLYPLPNVELPPKLIRSKKDRPEPGGFGMLDAMWPQRSQKAGTYDDEWLKTRFPGFAADMDWSIFNTAPSDQQQADPFHGDEPFTIEGMHPTKPRLKGRLSGIAARCLINQRGTDGDALRDVALRLTTVWLFPHAERYLLVFHGSQEVTDDAAADVQYAVIAAEKLGDPRDLRHYREVVKQRLDPDTGALHLLRDGDLLPPDTEAVEDDALAEMKALLATDGLRRKYQRRRHERRIEQVRAQVASRGLDPDVYGPKPLPPESPPPALSELPAFAEKLRTDAKRKMEEERVARAVRGEALRARLLEQNVDADAMLPKVGTGVSGPPTFSARAAIQRMSDLSAEYTAKGIPVKMLDDLAADPERRKLLEQAEESHREAYRRMAHHQAAAPRLTGEEAARCRATVLATLKNQRSLARSNLTGFDLSGLDLRGVDLSGAWLENAHLARANLEGAKLVGAVIARADLTETNLTHADLRRANLALTELVRATADGAILSEAILEKAEIRRTTFRGAKLDGVSLMEASISQSDLSGVALPSVTFMKTQLNGLCFNGADLTGSTFFEADVRGADFTGACLERATFLKTNGEGAIFAEARLANACFVQECRFERANFRKAILAPVNLRGTRLSGSDFCKAQLARADLSECDLSGAKFYRTNAREARFVKANLSGAVLVSANLMNAVLQNADLRGADLRGTNLFQADLARVWTDDRTNVQDTNRKKARLLPERATP